MPDERRPLIPGAVSSRGETVARALVALGVALICAGVCGCGSPRRSASGSTPAYTVPETGTITTSFIPPGQHVRGDGDADNPSDIDGSGDSDSARVGGADNDQDAPVPDSYRFPDADDAQALAFGRAASAGERAAIEAVVKRYFAAAAAANGAAACGLLEPALPRTLPEDNAGPREPAYVRGAKTCPEVLTRTFAHFHAELAAPISVHTVRVQGSEAHAILASRTLRAGVAFLVRQRGAWWMVQLFSQTLT